MTKKQLKAENEQLKQRIKFLEDKIQNAISTVQEVRNSFRKRSNCCDAVIDDRGLCLMCLEHV